MTIRSLFDVAAVKRGDGTWMRGYEAEFDVDGRTYSVNGRVCDPTTTPDPSGSRSPFNIKPFVVETKQKFSTFCEPVVADKSTSEDLDDATEYLVAKNFWLGDAADWDGVSEGVFLAHANVTTVPAGTSTVASIAAALQKAYDDAPGLVGEAVVHLGVTASLSLPSGFTDDHPNVTFVESAGYPTNGVAVTGPVKVNISDVQAVRVSDHATGVHAGSLATVTVNDLITYANRFATVEFDPRLAVRVA